MPNPKTTKTQEVLAELFERAKRLSKQTEKVKLAGLIQKSQRLRQEAERTAESIRELEKTIDEAAEKEQPAHRQPKQG